MIIIVRAVGSLLFNDITIKKNKTNCYIKDPKFFRMIVIRTFIYTFGGLVGRCGFAYVTISDGSALEFLLPIWAIIMSCTIFKEKISNKQIFFTLLSFCGMILIVRPGFLFH